MASFVVVKKGCPYCKEWKNMRRIINNRIFPSRIDTVDMFGCDPRLYHMKKNFGSDKANWEVPTGFIENKDFARIIGGYDYQTVGYHTVRGIDDLISLCYYIKSLQNYHITGVKELKFILSKR